MSLIKDIKDSIYDEIKRRPYMPGEKLPGVRELAKNYDVSYVTMSNALVMLAQEGIIKQFPGKGSFITELASKNSLALFVPDYLIGLRALNPLTDTTCLFGLMDVYTGLVSSIKREGFNLHVIPALAGQEEVERTYELATKKLNVSGAFFMALPTDNLIKRFADSGFPCCKLHTPGEAFYNYVAVDIEKGVFKLVKHLISLGHKRIAMLSGDIDNPWFKGRYSGYRKALEENNITFQPELVESLEMGELDENVLQASMERLLGLPEKPTAFFVTSDRWALCVMKMLQEKGFTVPGDFSIAGFDDYAESKVSNPPLTTIAQPFYDIGEQAFLLMKRLLLEPSEKINSIIEPNMIARKSTASPT